MAKGGDIERNGYSASEGNEDRWREGNEKERGRERGG